jgi:nicotinamide-nucleotide amidase
MLQGVIQNLNTDYGIAVSGIMGPSGGSAEKPVGTVWIAVGSAQKQVTRKFQLRFDRIKNIEVTATQALNELRLFLKNEKL